MYPLRVLHPLILMPNVGVTSLELYTHFNFHGDDRQEFITVYGSDKALEAISTLPTPSARMHAFNGLLDTLAAEWCEMWGYEFIKIDYQY